MSDFWLSSSKTVDLIITRIGGDAVFPHYPYFKQNSNIDKNSTAITLKMSKFHGDEYYYYTYILLLHYMSI